MKVTVLGCNGFIGRNLCSHLIESGFEVHGIGLQETASSTNVRYHQLNTQVGYSSVLDSLQNSAAVINAAGSGSVPFSVEHPSLDFERNVAHLSSILSEIRTQNIHCHFIQISSAAVYGNSPSLPIEETGKIDPCSPYGYSKWMAESLCEMYQRLFGQHISIIRPFSVYGPHQKKQIFYDICRKLENDEFPELFGTGRETRDFIHVNDLSRFIEMLIQKRKSEKLIETINAGTGTRTSIELLAREFSKHFANKKIRFKGEKRVGDPSDFQACVKRMKQLGFEPEISLATGVEDYVNWYKQFAS